MKTFLWLAFLVVLVVPGVLMRFDEWDASKWAFVGLWWICAAALAFYNLREKDKEQ